MNRSEGYAYEEAKKNAIFQQLHVAALVQVIATYPEKMEVDVKPLVKSLREGSYISQPPILRVPVMQLGSAAFPIRPQYEEGLCILTRTVIMYCYRDRKRSRRRKTTMRPHIQYFVELCKQMWIKILKPILR